jgi:hypothetical protein
MMKITNLILLSLTTLGGAVPFMSAEAAPSLTEDTNHPIVRYEDFGAQGDGKTDDIVAIAKAHAFANEHGLRVQANNNATYYISGQDHTAIIQTNTDFGTAKFIIDDTRVENRRTPIFAVKSKLQPVKLTDITSLSQNQLEINAKLAQDSLIRATDSTVKHFIRRGLNQNSGTSQVDVFVLSKEGRVDTDGPILWDFDQITNIIAYPIDSTTLTITGGRFTTIANSEESKYTYFSRGIDINRSNVMIDGLEHRIIGEGEQGAPYRGFIHISDCANVILRNTWLSGHKTYQTIGSADKPVSMGSYDLSITRAINVSLINCHQFNDILDRSLWGIMASNYCKNLLLDGCELSRFDAHQGVSGATIRNSTLGYMGINAIGSGTLLVENTTVYANSFINMRSDYGSSWQGAFIIRNCTFVPAGGKPISASLITGSNDGKHDFGYTCYMPNRITIDGLYIDDSKHPTHYEGPTLFADFNPQYIDASYQEQYPYIKTLEVILNDIRTASGKPLGLSQNSFMFQDVIVNNEG